ncbi:conjugal transfer transcriptional regulator TraJ [Rugamonas rivuli]|uniref:Conjugal transfer transcriptional regulator TraJ n=1 Tax=Rugamonas rivuli TaxID=2743358 RepID=A0A843SB11_9BURK|nr:conjugal transfer transcriptional regulator TraJ [Rugamonas rivuli]MQA21675.1 conjugal transfer transcriptional regulator TraJ [Rugamonas rivuli]
MEPTSKAPTRKALHLRVPVLQEEAQAIRLLASNAGLPVATYLRKVGLGYRVHGILDHRRVEELARINGDLGRLGGLLKLWLTDDARTARFGETTILAVLSKIEDTQRAMQDIMRDVVLPNSPRKHL